MPQQYTVRPVRVAGRVGALNGKLLTPLVGDDRRPCLLFVHQWGKMGGQGALMEGMAHLCAQRAYTCLTFDLRGVGASGGSATWTCRAEVDDVHAMCRWLYDTVAKPIVLVGSSAGAPTAGSALDAHDFVTGGVFMGYPFGCLASVVFGRHYAQVTGSTKPKLFVQGELDGFTSVAQLKRRVAACAGTANEFVVIRDVGHFDMEGPAYDGEMAGLIDAFVTTSMM